MKAQTENVSQVTEHTGETIVKSHPRPAAADIRGANFVRWMQRQKALRKEPEYDDSERHKQKERRALPMHWALIKISTGISKLHLLLQAPRRSAIEKIQRPQFLPKLSR